MWNQMKVYEELDDVKAANEKLISDCRSKTELLEKVQRKHLVEIQEAILVIEKQGFKSKEKTREISVLKLTNEDLRRRLREKDSILKHLEEAYEKLQNVFKACKKEWEEERPTLYSLQTKLDSQTRNSDELQKKLHMCNSVLTQEETRRKHLEIQVSEFKDRYEDAFAGYQDARTQLDDLAGKRDEEVAELRHSLSTKDAYFKEVKYENGKLQQENCELLFSLKELQAATIQGSGNTALSKLKKKFQDLENTHKNCSANLKSKESEWSSQLEKMAEEINDYKLQLQSKDGALKEVEVELENCHSSTAKMRLQYEEISVMFLVLSRTVSEAQSRLANVKAEQTKDEKREEKSYSLLIEQLESDSKENIRELCSKVDTAYAKLAEEVEKNVSLIRKIESIDQNEEQRRRELENYKEKLEEATKSKIILQEKVVELESHSTDVYEALETANCELSDKTSEACQLEFQLWIWKSIAKRLKAELEQNQNLRKRVEASLLEQVGVGEAMRQERNELVHKLKAITSSSSKTSDSEKESLIQIMREKDKILAQVQREVELLEQESLTRELEDAVFAHITAEILSGALKQKEDELCKVKNELEGSLKYVSLLLEQKQNEATMVYKAWEKLAASKILTDVETEAKMLMIIELEEEISSIRQKLETSDESVSCFREEATKLGAELETKQTELVKQVTNLSLERQNLMCFISELENEMSKLCDEDTKPMKALEKTVQSCDGFGKENNNIGSPRLVMKHEDVAIEVRSPFRQLNH